MVKKLVLSAAIAFGVTYLGQVTYAQAVAARANLARWSRHAVIGLTIVLVVASYSLFITGAFTATEAIRAHLTATAIAEGTERKPEKAATAKRLGGGESRGDEADPQ